MGKLIDLVGKRFGNLVVKERAANYVSPSGHPEVQWLCLCDCGNETIVYGNYLRSGHTKSCGCQQHCTPYTTHGMSSSRLYSIYENMKTRCYNPSHKLYPRYGGRGVRVCDEWRANPDAFIRWSLSNGYSEELTLDRINSNGDYEPANCRWVDWLMQQNNRSDNRVLELYGREQTIAQWSREKGYSPHLIAQRLGRGWTVEEAIETPPYAKRGRERAEEI